MRYGGRKTGWRKRSGIKKQTAGVGMGNDNEARRNVIISRLPNRSEPKTTASATGEKSIPSIAPSRGGITRQNWNHQWPSARLDGSVAPGSPAVIRVLSTHLLRTNLAQKPGSTPSRSENLSGEAKQKPQTIHYPFQQLPPQHKLLSLKV